MRSISWRQVRTALYCSVEHHQGLVFAKQGRRFIPCRAQTPCASSSSSGISSSRRLRVRRAAAAAAAAAAALAPTRIEHHQASTARLLHQHLADPVKTLCRKNDPTQIPTTLVCPKKWSQFSKWVSHESAHHQHRHQPAIANKSNSWKVPSHRAQSCNDRDLEKGNNFY